MQSTIPPDGRIVLFCALGRILRGNPRHATATLNVIGFSITFGLHTSAKRNVIGFPITFGPHATATLNVISFSTTFDRTPPWLQELTGK